MIFSIVERYLHNPFPLWQSELSDSLAQNKLLASGIIKQDYSTNLFLNLPTENYIGVNKLQIAESGLVLEIPATETLPFFYEECGLSIKSLSKDQITGEIVKINAALTQIAEVPFISASLHSIVLAIQLLNQEDEDIDCSYSHPNVPFTIFVSTCSDLSKLSSLRVAESILHESMHLQLTLIENVIPLVRDSEAQFYSPWRNEMRPVGGVIHGLYVFRAIHAFYKELPLQDDLILQSFIQKRITDIESEINSISSFATNLALTDAGKTFAARLFEF
ncbi:MAG: hypothetical protein JST83_18405 [Bacteroidetes bacterium]|nr:hypothetical protein [Bacteroidota bacterium]